jgi:hypothetical protein
MSEEMKIDECGSKFWYRNGKIHPKLKGLGFLFEKFVKIIIQKRDLKKEFVL